MAIITLSRQTGSGAGEIAARVAEQLGLRLVDRQVIYEAARAAGASWADLDEVERGKMTFAQRLLATIGVMPSVPTIASTRLREKAESVPYVPELTTGTDSTTAFGTLPVPVGPPPGIPYDELIRTIVDDLAERGNLLVVGRGGDVILGNRRDVLRVLVIAPFEARVGRIQAREGVGEAEAERLVRQADQDRAAFFQRTFRVQWPDPLREDLVINTDKIGTDLAVDLIVAAGRL